MEEKNNSIFRKQAVDRITSPEELNGYLKVTKPGIWFVLAAIIVLIVGVLAWAVLGKLETTVNVAVISSDDNVICLVPTEQVDDVLSSGKITIAEKEYKLKDAGFSKTLITADTNADILNSGLLAVGDVVVPLQIETQLSSGIYIGTIVTQAVKPISFIIN